MIKLDNKHYNRISHIITSQNELSVFSVINGITEGEVYVNNIDNPSAALIKTNECNLIAGETNDELFNSKVASLLDFWDHLTPDSNEWIDKIPDIHPNSFIRVYKRRHYQLSDSEFNECNVSLEEGFLLEKVDLKLLEEKNYENSDEVIEWVNSWGNIEKFNKYGTGYYIRHGKIIVSWSVSDCSYGDKIAIGVTTDRGYRNKGFGKKVVSATVKDCFNKGYKSIDWLCVDTNKCSIALAEKLGFKYINTYYSSTSYAPIENLKDLTEEQWYEWGEHLEKTSTIEKDALWDCLYSYIKSNSVEKTISTLNKLKKEDITINYLDIENRIKFFQTYGMCSNFTTNTPNDFFSTNSET